MDVIPGEKLAALSAACKAVGARRVVVTTDSAELTLEFLKSDETRLAELLQHKPENIGEN